MQLNINSIANIGIRSAITIPEHEDSESSGDERRNRKDKLKGLSDRYFRTLNLFSSEEEINTNNRKRKRDYEEDGDEQEEQDDED